jgi:hypothetical protein
MYRYTESDEKRDAENAASVFFAFVVIPFRFINVSIKHERIESTVPIIECKVWWIGRR